jgi:hypothetical protein
VVRLHLQPHLELRRRRRREQRRARRRVLGRDVPVDGTGLCGEMCARSGEVNRSASSAAGFSD